MKKTGLRKIISSGLLVFQPPVLVFRAIIRRAYYIIVSTSGSKAVVLAIGDSAYVRAVPTRGVYYIEVYAVAMTDRLCCSACAENITLLPMVLYSYYYDVLQSISSVAYEQFRFQTCN